MVSVLATGPKIRRFKAGGRRIFKGDKNRSNPSFGSKAVGSIYETGTRSTEPLL
jgi:hypothetical protein